MKRVPALAISAVIGASVVHAPHRGPDTRAAIDATFRRRTTLEAGTIVFASATVTPEAFLTVSAVRTEMKRFTALAVGTVVGASVVHAPHRCPDTCAAIDAKSRRFTALKALAIVLAFTRNAGPGFAGVSVSPGRSPPPFPGPQPPANAIMAATRSERIGAVPVFISRFLAMS